MSERTDDSFDLGESEVKVRSAPRGRSWLRVIAAFVPVAIGLICFYLAAVFWLIGFARTGLGFGTLFLGLGFAIYDYRGPFGPRPGLAHKHEREDHELREQDEDEWRKRRRR